jgi:hypothetical protein
LQCAADDEASKSEMILSIRAMSSNSSSKRPGWLSMPDLNDVEVIDVIETGH